MPASRSWIDVGTYSWFVVGRVEPEVPVLACSLLDAVRWSGSPGAGRRRCRPSTHSMHPLQVVRIHGDAEQAAAALLLLLLRRWRSRGETAPGWKPPSSSRNSAELRPGEPPEIPFWPWSRIVLSIDGQVDGVIDERRQPVSAAVAVVQAARAGDAPCFRTALWEGARRGVPLLASDATDRRCPAPAPTSLTRPRDRRVRAGRVAVAARRAVLRNPLAGARKRMPVMSRKTEDLPRASPRDR